MNFFLFKIQMAHTYILYSEKLDKYYVGSSYDKNERLIRHNRGAEKFTSTGIPWVIVYFEEFETTKEARSREMAIKKKKSRKYIEALVSSTG